jgi:hypothetical protein
MNFVKNILQFSLIGEINEKANLFTDKNRKPSPDSSQERTFRTTMQSKNKNSIEQNTSLDQINKLDNNKYNGTSNFNSQKNSSNS